MILIRFLGWCLIGVASVAASAEAVLALTPGALPSPGLATGEVWTLLSGMPAGALASPDHWMDMVAASVMTMPAWTVFALLGIVMVVLGRLRRRKHRHRAFV
jgi:hypothetical protein